MYKKSLLIGCGLALAGILQTHAAIVLTDPFSYADGSLTNVSALKWSNHSGTGGQVDVAGGKINLTQTESEDVNALLGGQPFAVDSGATLYARFKVNLSALPTGAGGYFAHFKDATTAFRARLFATVTGAAAGTFRIGIANAGSGPSATLVTDLSLNTEYTVVMAYGVTTTASSVWINPTAETDTPATATDTTTAVPIASFALRQSLSGGAGMGTMTVDDLVVATSFAEALAGPPTGIKPSITTEPVDASVESGRTASFNVVASGTDPLAYLWQFNNDDIVEANGAIYSFTAADGKAGNYRVIVSNAFGSVTSRVATLTVTAPVGPIATTIADLHSKVDPITYAPTNTTQLYTVEGIVTTHKNVTTDANALFYIQDETTGIAVFDSGAGTLRPQAGDRVRVTGPLGIFSGLLELNLVSTNPEHSVTTLSLGNPLPAPRPLDFALQGDVALMQALVGSRVIATNVTLDLTTPNFPGASGGNVTLSDVSGQTFVLRVDARITDIVNQPKPTTAVDIIGVLGQFDSSSPFNSGYQLIPTRFADIIGGALAPKIDFTNTLSLIRKGDALTNNFGEIVLLPGERVTIRARAFGADGSNVDLSAPLAGLPAGATWSLSAPSGPDLTAIFTFQASAAEAGQKYQVELDAANPQVTNAAKWSIYVPTGAEQQITVSEFSANAPGANTNPYGNILQRLVTPAAPNSDDEFVELANLGSADVNLRNWTIGDSVQVRHKFYDFFPLPAHGAAVVYGGPLNGAEPQLDVPIIPASENAFGFGLNNTGGDMIIVRNAEGNLVSRVVFGALPADSTMTRFPDLNGAFVPQLSVSSAVSTPGRQFNGALFSEPAPTVAAVTVTATLQSGSVRLAWPAQDGLKYTVLGASDISGPYQPVATGVTAISGQGEHLEALPAGTGAKFFQVTAP